MIFLTKTQKHRTFLADYQHITDVQRIYKLVVIKVMVIKVINDFQLEGCFQGHNI